MLENSILIIYQNVKIANQISEVFMKKVFIFIFAIFSIFFSYSYGKEYKSLSEVLKYSADTNIVKAGGKIKKFNVVRYIIGQYSKETIYAKNIYSMSNIDVYLEEGLIVNDSNLLKILKEVVRIYDMEEYLYGKIDKLTLLIMDINGGYSYDNPYMQGYSVLDGIGNGEDNIIFLDYINGWENIASVVNTIAHELHHIINYSSVKSGGGLFDTWVDEALSEAAVIAYRGYMPLNRLDYYNSDSKNMALISRGDYFYKWSKTYTVHEYSTVALFMYWLGVQSDNGFEIYKDIAFAPMEYRGMYKAILYAAQKQIYSFKDWSELYVAWLKANYMNENSGLFGYKDLIKTMPTILTNKSNIYLAPGGAVYLHGDFVSDDDLLRYIDLGNDTYIVYNPDVNISGKDRLLTINP